jgi:transcriptional regulator with XRE-family HTH domain
MLDNTTYKHIRSYKIHAYDQHYYCFSDTISRVDDVDRSVGKKLRLRRLLLGLSQQAVGESLDVSIQQIQKYEKATNRISSSNLYKLSKRLKVPLDYFFEDVTSTISTNFAEDQTEFSNDSNHEREILTLVRNYNEIRDQSVRKKILDLVKTLSPIK